MKTENIAIIAIIASLTFVAFIGIGWVMNLFAVFNSSFDPITGQVVLRTIGIFVPPLGGVMGWF